MESAKNLNDVQFFRVCAALRRIAVDDGVPSVEARRRAAHLARSLGIDTDANILPPGVVCAGLSDIHVAALSLRTSECIK
jgi:hypothetical protein